MRVGEEGEERASCRKGRVEERSDLYSAIPSSSQRSRPKPGVDHPNDDSGDDDDGDDVDDDDDDDNNNDDDDDNNNDDAKFSQI